MDCAAASSVVSAAAAGLGLAACFAAWRLRVVTDGLLGLVSMAVPAAAAAAGGSAVDGASCVAAPASCCAGSAALPALPLLDLLLCTAGAALLGAADASCAAGAAFGAALTGTGGCSGLASADLPALIARLVARTAGSAATAAGGDSRSSAAATSAGSAASCLVRALPTLAALPVCCWVAGVLAVPALGPAGGRPLSMGSGDVKPTPAAGLDLPALPCLPRCCACISGEANMAAAVEGLALPALADRLPGRSSGDASSARTGVGLALPALAGRAVGSMSAAGEAMPLASSSFCIASLLPLANAFLADLVLRAAGASDTIFPLVVGPEVPAAGGLQKGAVAAAAAGVVRVAGELRGTAWVGVRP